MINTSVSNGVTLQYGSAVITDVRNYSTLSTSNNTVYFACITSSGNVSYVGSQPYSYDISSYDYLILWTSIQSATVTFS